MKIELGEHNFQFLFKTLEEDLHLDLYDKAREKVFYYQDCWTILHANRIPDRPMYNQVFYDLDQK